MLVQSLSTGLDQYILALYPRGIDVDASLGIVQRAARAQIKRPGVPGADDAALFNQSLPERAAAVGALVVRNGEAAFDHSRAVETLPHCKFTDFAFSGQISSGTEAQPLRHIKQLSRAGIFLMLRSNTE